MYGIILSESNIGALSATNKTPIKVFTTRSQRITKNPAIKKDFARVAKKHNIKRVQTGIRKDFKEGIRFAEWLGLEREGLMKNWGFDGSDQYLYARIF